MIWIMRISDSSYHMPYTLPKGPIQVHSRPGSNPLREEPMNRLPFLALIAVAAIAIGPATAFAQQVRLRIGHDQPAGTMYDEGHTMFRKLVEERSTGRIKVDIFPAAQLGSEVAMIEGVRMGSLDASVAHVANASTVVP